MFVQDYANAINLSGGTMPREALISSQELADYTGNSLRTILRWRAEVQGPAFVRIGGHVRYRPQDIDAWLESQRVVPAREREAS